MSLYTYTVAYQQFDTLFDEAKARHEVMIQRPDGDLFVLRLVKAHGLRQSLPQLGIHLSRQDIVESIREVRERT